MLDTLSSAIQRRRGKRRSVQSGAGAIEGNDRPRLASRFKPTRAAGKKDNLSSKEEGGSLKAQTRQRGETAVKNNHPPLFGLGQFFPERVKPSSGCENEPVKASVMEGRVRVEGERDRSKKFYPPVPSYPGNEVGEL